MMRQLVRLAGPVALVALLSPAARGEEDFKYGMALYKEFQFEDLAIKFFTELKEAGSQNDRVSGVFGLGGIKEEQARAAAKRNDPAEAERLYREARELYDQFMKEAPSKHPERSNVLARIGDIRKKEALELVKQAKAEPGRRQELLGKARSILEELVKPLEEQAKRTMKAYVDFVNGRDPATIRGRDEVALQKFLNEAVVAMQRLYLMQAELAEVYDKGSAERTAFLEKMIADIDAKSEFWEKEGFPGVLMWLNHMLGRTYALAGKPKEAYEKGFEPVIAENPGPLSGGARKFVDDLRMVSFYLKAKTASEAKDYEMVIKTVEQMFGPAIGPGGGYPDGLSDDRGNGAMIFKAKAYLQRPEPDFLAAVQACQKVINAHKGNWPNNARQLLAEIKSKMPREEMLSLGAETLHEMALGDFQLALQPSGRSERRKLLERAIAGYNDAIGACRDKATPYRMRLQHEPAAWFELGVCYSKINLWYEAGFAFEGTL